MHGTVAGVALALALVSFGLGAQALNYRFERYFPAVQQPWFFQWVDKFAADQSTGIIVTYEFLFGTVLKLLTLNGQFSSEIRPQRRIEGLYARDGFIYTIDEGTPLIRRYDPFRGGATQTLILSQLPSTRSDLAVDALGRIFLLDTAARTVWSYRADGTLRATWGGQGSGFGSFMTPAAIDVVEDANGNTNVLVVDSELHLIQRFDIFGSFLSQWGNSSELFFPRELAVGADGRIYVVVAAGIRVYEGIDGPAINLIANSNLIRDVEVDSLGRIQALEQVTGALGFRSFNPDGSPATRWAVYGSGPGVLLNPVAVAVGPNGNYYVLERGSGTIEVFSPTGAPLNTFAPGLFFPTDLFVNPAGEIFVLNGGSMVAIIKLDASGNEVQRYGSQGSGAGQFRGATAIDGYTDAMGNRFLYVADPGNYRVHKITESGTFIGTWGSAGAGNSQFGGPPFDSLDSMHGLAVGDDGSVFVTDAGNDRIQQFTFNGGYVNQFSTAGRGDPRSINVDSAGNLFVMFYLGKEKVRVYDANFNDLGPLVPPNFIGSIFNVEADVAITADDRVVHLDDNDFRVTVYRNTGPPTQDRAIVLAGGGPFSGNSLWQATQVNANFAYRVLAYQGFTKNTIYYLSDAVDTDIDQNGVLDDVDAPASNTALREAILGPSGDGLSGFAAAAERLFIYFTDHGGQDRFRMSATETLDAAVFSGWIDTWQQNHPGARVVIVYDACQSGSFLQSLSGATDRVVVTSSLDNENAYFVSQGALSFSNFFWTQVFNGLSVGNAFGVAESATTRAFPQQHPQIDANGDGLFEPADQAAVADLFIGNGTLNGGADAPVIGRLTPDQNLSGTNVATLRAFNVNDDDGISRVWAVIRPPGFNPGSPDNPIQDLPGFDLVPVPATADFEAAYDRFDKVGTYQIAVYAADTFGNTSVPQITTISIDNPLRRRAVVVAAGALGDANQEAFQTSAQIAVRALEEQGYGPDFGSCGDTTCDDINFLVATGVAGADGTPAGVNVMDAIVRWGVDPDQNGVPDVQDLSIYLTGEMVGGELRLDNQDALSAVQLDGWLDQVQSLLPGTLTLIVDADDAGSFTSQLSLDAPGQDRIIIASAGSGQKAVFLDAGNIGFARFFWSQVLNGATVRSAFRIAGQAVRFAPDGPIAELEDNGNSTPNELLDGLLSSRYAIGTGILLAGDDPLIGAISLPGPITAAGFEIVAEDVTSTGTLVDVSAIITFADGSQDLVPLADQGNGRWSATPPSLNLDTSDVEIAVFARDLDGNTSLPLTTQARGDHLFESGFETNP